MVCFTSVRSQQYITPSIGYSLAFFSSDDLDLFKDTYNSFHRSFQFGLIKGFSGLSQPVGIRLELGYHHFGKLAMFANVGFQNVFTKDFAEFDNFEERELILRQRSFLIEGGIGPRIKQFFITGVFAVYFNKKLSLESSYRAPPDPEGANPLNGKYESNNTISTDFGISVGVNKDPVILTLKLMYPLFTGGKNEVLIDDNLAKIAAGTSVFPDNFESSFFNEPYKGIKSNIDGFKIILTLGIPLQVRE